MGKPAIKISLVFLLVLPSCQDFLEIEPPKTSLINETVFAADATATAAITGIYSRMVQTFSSKFATGFNSISLLTGLSSDELKNHATAQFNIEFFENELSPSNAFIGNWWTEFYKYIYTVNSVIDGIAQSEKLSIEGKLQLEGEAKFIRAFCYFYLVNLFGDVPYTSSTNSNFNSLIAKTSESDIYNQIIADLRDAQNLLTAEYLRGARLRPNKFTATALLARVYLYMEEWANAEAEASSIIDNSTYALESDPRDVFYLGSDETIWQIKPVQPEMNTFENWAFNYFGIGPYRYASMSNGLAHSFESGDDRNLAWVDFRVLGIDTFRYNNKYKANRGALTEYLIVFRLAEQYLIRSEARAQQNKIMGSKEDLNVIRNRAGLSNIEFSDQSALLQAIEQERRVELFSEWGHRWFDLKRTNRLTPVLSTIKSKWQPMDILFPIPTSELAKNPKITQNQGY